MLLQQVLFFPSSLFSSTAAPDRAVNIPLFTLEGDQLQINTCLSVVCCADGTISCRVSALSKKRGLRIKKKKKKVSSEARGAKGTCCLSCFADLFGTQRGGGAASAPLVGRLPHPMTRRQQHPQTEKTLFRLSELLQKTQTGRKCPSLLFSSLPLSSFLFRALLFLLPFCLSLIRKNLK